MTRPPTAALQVAIDGSAVPYSSTIPAPVRPPRRRRRPAADADAKPAAGPGQLDGLDAIAALTRPRPPARPDQPMESNSRDLVQS